MIDSIEKIMDEKEGAKLDFMKTQAEKTIYLGEFKENVLGAIEIDEIKLGVIHPEIKRLMKDKRVEVVKIKRSVPFDLIKPYISEAEKIGIRYTLVDDISFVGDVGLVVVSKEALNNEDENVILESVTKKYTDAGLSAAYIYGEGKRISSKNYEELKERLPEEIHKFEKMNFFDKIFGHVCPVEKNKKK